MTKGTVMYVTLEPCCHYGKQPPCTEAILESGIKRVVVGAADPNPIVAGKGIRYLRENGIEVEEGVLREECSQLIEAFSYFIKTGRPYVVMKYAMTLDGKIAAKGTYDAVICLGGAVIRGSTSHYDYVCSEVSKGIVQLGPLRW